MTGRCSYVHRFPALSRAESHLLQFRAMAGSKAERDPYVDEAVRHGIADLRGEWSTGKGNGLAKERRSKDIDRWGEVDFVQGVEG